MRKLAFLAAFLLVPTLTFATSQTLPIINRNEFKACFFGWCQTVAPPFLFTDFNTSTNYYNVTNSTINNITNIFQGANVSSKTCGGTDKISAINNATGEVTCTADQNSEGGGNTTEEVRNAVNNSGFYNITANVSNYCSIVLGQTCVNSSYTYNPFETPKTCNNTFGFDCGNTTPNGAGGYGLNDSFLGCDGTATSGSYYVKNVYLNQSSVLFGQPLNATCEFKILTPSTQYEYIWYDNDSTANNWVQLLSDNVGSSGTWNLSVVFTPNSTANTQIVRCIYSRNNQTFGYCANSSNTTIWDNDDANFTVSATDTGNITVNTTTCSNAIQNITANNSLFFNGLASSYFYPYSNPLGFLTSIPFYNNLSVGDVNTTDYYQIKVNHSSILNMPNYLLTEIESQWSANYSAFNTSWSTTFNITYANWNKTYADTLYSPISTPANTSNNTLFCNGLSCLVNSSLNTFNASYNAQLGHNTSAEIIATINTSATFYQILVANSSNTTSGIPASYVNGLSLAYNSSTQIINAVNTSQTFYNVLANNSNYLGGQYGSYFWNITGGIPSTNLTITSNLNMSIYNQSYYISATSVPTCTKDYNGASLLWCDCFNSTNKWVSNTC